MQEIDGDVQTAETFKIPLQGFIVECTSVEDAVAIKNSDMVISGRDGVTYMPSELMQMAAVCMHYGRKSAADQLANHASRLRAAAFLRDSVKYVRPEKR